MYQYYCPKCGYERQGLLKYPAGIGGVATNCPECRGNYFSEPVIVEDGEKE